MNELSPKSQDKFRAYRARKKAAGLRELRLWVPDLRSSEVVARWRKEGEILRNHPSEKGAADFFDALITENPEFYG
jgi:Protein  of unknown function (DUF3018)